MTTAISLLPAPLHCRMYIVRLIQGCSPLSEAGTTNHKHASMPRHAPCAGALQPCSTAAAGGGSLQWHDGSLSTPVQRSQAADVLVFAPGSAPPAVRPSQATWQLQARPAPAAAGVPAAPWRPPAPPCLFHPASPDALTHRSAAPAPALVADSDAGGALALRPPAAAWQLTPAQPAAVSLQLALGGLGAAAAIMHRQQRALALRVSGALLLPQAKQAALSPLPPRTHALAVGAAGGAAGAVAGPALCASASGAPFAAGRYHHPGSGSGGGGIALTPGVAPGRLGVAAVVAAGLLCAGWAAWDQQAWPPLGPGPAMVGERGSFTAAPDASAGGGGVERAPPAGPSSATGQPAAEDGVTYDQWMDGRLSATIAQFQAQEAWLQSELGALRMLPRSRDSRARAAAIREQLESIAILRCARWRGPASA